MKRYLWNRGKKVKLTPTNIINLVNEILQVSDFQNEIISINQKILENNNKYTRSLIELMSPQIGV